MALTSKQKKAYLKHYYHCPFCKSKNIEGHGIKVDEDDGDCAWQEVVCLDCDKRWNDIYKLVDVEEAER